MRDAGWVAGPCWICGCLRSIAGSFDAGSILSLFADFLLGCADVWFRLFLTRNMLALDVDCNSASSGMSCFSFVFLNSLQVCCISVTM
jgi:hypothetical protein